MIIYSLTFPNEKKYIGCTTAPLKRRVQEHFQKAKRGHKSNLHKALRKFKFKIEIKVLKKCSSKEEMFKSEKNYIKRHRSNLVDHGYNMSAGGEFGHCGHVITDKRRKASRDRKLEGWKNGKFDFMKRPLVNLTTGEHYESVSDASRKLNRSLAQVITSTKKKLKVNGCYLWDYRKNLNIKSKLKQVEKEVRLRQSNKVNIFGFKVTCINNNKTYGSYPEAAKDLGISTAGICKSLKSKKPVKGFTFKLFKEEHDKAIKKLRVVQALPR